jgi:DNA processing protein
MHPATTEIIIHLSLQQDVGPQACVLLLEKFSDDLSQLYLINAHELRERTGLPLARCEKIVKGLADKLALQREQELIQKYEISVVTLAEAAYPHLLRSIHAPPIALYYRGNLEILSKTLAFVGSRKADSYGQQVVTSLIPEVVKEGFTTISGGALGIDGMVHRATVQEGGRTVAVLGSGLLEPYPKAHKGLFEEIVFSGGIVMSAFPLLMQPLAINFPARNRIIAGLSQATIVIQAARKSGALLTAKNALDEGRDVGVVPGSIFNELSAGCHDLLAQGAHAITAPQDIFDLIGYNPEIARPVTSAIAQRAAAGSERRQVQARAISKDPLLALCNTPKSTDELLLKAGYSYDVLQERLWQLQIEGALEQNMLGMWCCVE